MSQARPIGRHLHSADDAANAAPVPDVCRLCAGEVRRDFELSVLARHRVGYHVCRNCSSLQTDPPYWLDEAYSSNLSDLDTGAVQRTLKNLSVCWSIARLFGVHNVLDFGGGDGLLCRLMRDYGLNCYVQDKYARPTYAQAYVEPDFSVPDMVTAFEVLEHFARPGEEIVALFRARPKLVLVSTLLYTGQGRDWWYLSPESGQHVFFYSPDAIRQLAARFGYAALIGSTYILFAQPELLSGLRRRLAALLLRGSVNALVRATMQLLPADGAARDNEALRSRS